MKFLDRDHPFFATAWVRWLTVGLPVLWGGVEVWLGNPGWGAFFITAGVVAGWELFIRK